MRGPVGQRTFFSCCIQVVPVVSKILSCAWNRGRMKRDKRRMKREEFEEGAAGAYNNE